MTENNAKAGYLDQLYNSPDEGSEHLRQCLAKLNIDFRKPNNYTVEQMRKACLIASYGDNPAEYLKITTTNPDQDYIAVICCKNSNWDLYNAICKVCDSAPTENERALRYAIYKNYFSNFDYDYPGEGAKLDLAFTNPAFSTDRLFYLLSFIGLYFEEDVTKGFPECLDPDKTTDQQVKVILDTEFQQNNLRKLKRQFNVV